MAIGRNPQFTEDHHHHHLLHHEIHPEKGTFHVVPGMRGGGYTSYGMETNISSVFEIPMLPILPDPVVISVDNTATGPDTVYSWSFYAIIIGGILLSLFTVLGNMMVLLSFKMDRSLQTITNYFLLSLALADLSVGVISIPFMTYYTALGSWDIGYTLCQFWLCMDYLMCNASVMNLLLISFDRYFSVTRPLTYRPKRTSRKAILAIMATFLVSALLWPPWIIGWPYIDGQFTAPQGSCYIQFLETSPFITVVTSFAAFWCPVTIMIILYIRVYLVAKQRRRVFSKMDPNMSINFGSRKGDPDSTELPGTVAEKRIAKEMKKSENKAAKTLLAIMLAFIVTWLPYDVIVLWEVFYPHTTPINLWSAAYALCYVNSFLNPICYALGNPQYRKTYLKILQCQFRTGHRMRRRSTVEDKI